MVIRWWRRRKERKRIGVTLPPVDRQWIEQMKHLQDESPTTYLWGEST